MIIPEKVIKVTESAVQPIPNDVVKAIDYLILNLPDGVNVAMIDKVIVSGDALFVGDYKTERIFVFDRQGNFQGMLDKKGRGPGEYLSVQSFTVDDGYVYVMDHFKKSLLAYKRETLEFDYEIKIPFYAWDFAALSEGGFIFAYAPMEGNSVTDPSLRYRIFVTDRELNIQERYFAYDQKEVDAVSIRHYLSTSGDKIVYGSFRDDGFCVFDGRNGKLVEKTVFAFSNGLNKDQKSQIEKLMDGHHTFLNRVPYLSGEFLVFSLSMENGGGLFLFDEATDSLWVQAPNPGGKMLVGVLGSDDYSLIGWLQDKSIYEYLVQNMGFPSATPEQEAAILADEPFLVFYQIK